MFCFPGPSGLFLCVGAAVLQNVVEPTMKGLKWVTTTTNLKLLGAGYSFADADWADKARLLRE